MLKGLTNTIKNACNDIELTLSEYIVIGGKTIPIKAELNDDCYDNGNFVGTFILKELKFEASNEISYINKEFEYYKRINGESIKIGTFITTEINNSDSEEVTKVVAMDYGLKTQIEYKSNLDYSSGNITLLDVWNECCELSGLESGVTKFTNSDFIVTDDQFTGTGATIRDVFIGIGLSSGSFIKVMNDDKIYPIFNEYDSNIKSGNNITLENDINNNPIDIQIDGKSEQETRSGKNLLKNTNVNSGDNNYWSSYSTFNESTNTLTRSTTATTESYISHRLNGIKSGTQYTLSLEAKSNGYVKHMDLYCYNSSVSGIKSKLMIPLTTDYQKITWTFTTDSSIDYSTNSMIRIDNNGSTTSGTEAILTVRNVMLVEGTDTDFEPYGASPSPDYPSEIKSVSGVENLCLNSRVEDTQTISGITFTKRKDGSVVANGTSTSSLKYYFQPDGEITKVLKAGNYIGSTRMINAPTSGTVTAYIRNGEDGDYKLFGGKTVRQTIQLDTDFTYTCSYIYFSSGVTLDNCIMYPSINKGNTLLPYVPYGHWLEIKDNGYNLCNSDYIRNNYSSSGLTVSKINDDVKVSGTNTRSSAVGIPLFISGNYISLRAGVKYSAKYITGKSASSTTYRMDIRPNNSLGTILAYESGINGLTYTPTSDIDIVLCVRIPGNGTVDLTGKIILCEGDLKEYEPYQEQSILIDMNKPNLFDNVAFVEGSSKYYSYDETTGITINKNDEYAWNSIGYKIQIGNNKQYKISVTNIDDYSTLRFGQFKSDGTWIKAISPSSDGLVTFNSDCSYVTLKIIPSEFPKTIGFITLISGCDDYYELSSIGDTKDELNIDKDGNVSITQNIGEVVLNGSENWAKNGNETVYYCTSNILGNIKQQLNNDTAPYLISTHFRTVAPSQMWTNTTNDLTITSFISKNNEPRIRYNAISTVDNFKTWLSTHPVTVKYILAEPQTISLGKITPLKLLEGTNNITTNDELQPNMKIKYSVINEIIEEYTELEDKRDTQPITCLRLGLSQIEGENVDIQDEDLIKKYGEHWLIINDNPFAYTQEKRVELINAIFDKVKGFGYSAFVSKTSFKPYLTCGDVIKFRNKAGELVKSIVLRYNHDFDEITLEAPSETSATVNYVYPTKDIDLIKRTEIIVDKNTNQITSLTQQTTSIQDDLQQNYYDKTQTNQLIQTSSTGITNTFSEAGGNNIFRNTGLWFEDSSTSYYIYPKSDLYPNNKTFTNGQRAYEFWDGLVLKEYYDKAANLTSLLLQNGYFEQKQQVPNGNYTVSFKYKKLIESATTKVIINNVEYNLTKLQDTEFRTGEQDSDGNYITQPLEVTDGYIFVRFYTNVNNSTIIYDLMVNAGSVKLAYSQNQNETTTDTVNISKGITITSSNTDTTFKANSDGIRTLNKNNETLSEFTDKGMKNKQIEVTDEATIVKVLWQNVGGQTWLTRL